MVGIIECGPAPSEAVDRLNLYAIDCQNRGHYFSGAVALRRALALAPDNAMLLGNLGGVLYHHGKYDEAAEVLYRSLELEPQSNIAMTNLGLVLASRGDFDAGIKMLDKAIETLPASSWSRWNRALTKFRAGRWKEGFDEYECRVEYRGEPFYYKMPFPFWQGEDLSGKTLMVIEEQGIGDRILFSRYIYHIKQRWPDCKILLMAHHNMQNLLWGFKDLVTFVPDQAPWPKADYGIYEVSAGRFIPTTLDDVPPDPGFIHARVSASKGSVRLPEPHVPSLKVGIAWTGNPENNTNCNRSIPLEYLLELAENPNVTLYSLQVGPGHGDLDRLAAGELAYDLGPACTKKGLVGTCMVMMNLDLIITVCTSIAHMAGACRVPVWTLLCDDPYWIWGYEGNKTKWYPSMRLFRQKHPGDWRSVIEEVKLALSDLTAQRFVLAA